MKPRVLLLRQHNRLRCRGLKGKALAAKVHAAAKARKAMLEETKKKMKQAKVKATKEAEKKVKQTKQKAAKETKKMK